MKGFVAVLSLVLLALVCNSGALHVPAAGVAAAQECCVRNTDNASFQQFHDRDSIRQKKDSDITGIIGEIPDVACRAGASVKGCIFGTYLWKRPIFSEFYSGISFAA